MSHTISGSIAPRMAGTSPRANASYKLWTRLTFCCDMRVPPSACAYYSSCGWYSSDFNRHQQYARKRRVCHRGIVRRLNQWSTEILDGADYRLCNEAMRVQAFRGVVMFNASLTLFQLPNP